MGGLWVVGTHIRRLSHTFNTLANTYKRKCTAGKPHTAAGPATLVHLCVCFAVCLCVSVYQTNMHRTHRIASRRVVFFVDWRRCLCGRHVSMHGYFVRSIATRLTLLYSKVYIHSSTHGWRLGKGGGGRVDIRIHFSSINSRSGCVVKSFRS